MLKFMIEKLEDVAEPLRTLYKKGDDGKFYLEAEVETHPRFKAIEKNKSDILDEKKKLQDKLDQQEAKLKEDKVKGHISAQEFEQAMALKQTEFDDKVAKLTASAETLKTQLKQTMVDNVANAMAAELGGENAHLLDPVVRGRLEVIEKDGVLKLYVKDAAGNACSMTPEQLKKEIGDDKRYAAVIKGRESSGGNANPGGGGGGKEAEFEGFFNPESKTFSMTKQAELEKTHPAEFKILMDKYDPLAKLPGFAKRA